MHYFNFLNPLGRCQKPLSGFSDQVVVASGPQRRAEATVIDNKLDRKVTRKFGYSFLFLQILLVLGPPPPCCQPFHFKLWKFFTFSLSVPFTQDWIPYVLFQQAKLGPMEGYIKPLESGLGHQHSLKAGWSLVEKKYVVILLKKVMILPLMLKFRF